MSDVYAGIGCTHIDHNTDHPRLAEVKRIIGIKSESRIGACGGYPDKWMILGNTVIVASIGHDGAPDLIVLPVKDFLKEYEFYLDE